MASTASVKGRVTGAGRSRGGPASGADSAPQRFPGCDDFATVVMAAMAAHMMRTLQLAAIAALRIGFVRQSMVAPAHAPAGRRGLSLGYSHGTTPLFLRCR